MTVKHVISTSSSTVAQKRLVNNWEVTSEVGHSSSPHRDPYTLQRELKYCICLLPAACYGSGVYFVVESSYSAQDKYSVPDSSGLRYMFVCRVIIGEYAKGNKDMKTAHEDCPSTDTWLQWSFWYSSWKCEHSNNFCSLDWCPGLPWVPYHIK